MSGSNDPGGESIDSRHGSAPDVAGLIRTNAETVERIRRLLAQEEGEEAREDETIGGISLYWLASFASERGVGDHSVMMPPLWLATVAEHITGFGDEPIDLVPVVRRMAEHVLALVEEYNEWQLHPRKVEGLWRMLRRTR